MKHCKIDPKTASQEEIRSEISRLTLLMNEKYNEEQAIKIFINSVYGATASPYFVGYNVRVAEAITLQGQEMIKFVSKIINRYFLEFWHRDKELHQKIGLTKVDRVTVDNKTFHHKQPRPDHVIRYLGLRNKDIEINLVH